MNRLDWFVAVTPFVVIGGMGWWTVHHHQKRCLCCARQHPTVAARRLHEQIWRTHGPAPKVVFEPETMP